MSGAMSEEAVEILQAWSQDGELVVTLHQVWDEPGFWGVFLVDIARHVSRAYEQSSGKPEDETMAIIRKYFEAEWDEPTDTPEGSLHN